MTVLSIIPGVGGALGWIPAAIILMTTGEVWRGIALALFIVGPILAALFVTAWKMFGTAFRTALAEPRAAASDPDYRPPA